MFDRTAFEMWLDFDEDQMQMLAGRNESGDYLHATIAIQWEAWQAATKAEREACAKVCEELVRGYDMSGNKYDVPKHYSPRLCASAIRATTKGLT